MFKIVNVGFAEVKSTKVPVVRGRNLYFVTGIAGGNSASK